ncbi:TetR/AcrR family transcriptional regulator C-terminal domain-containing protein [Actinoplanes sp. NPDC051633]|uniref:TetR/AcrR family transcriptional regulator C-terminal domain-containing protein n=1 Tax=Actinoplanes sp. NPDC051633 TaxID=3155670 RepID=UPI00342642D0
MPRRSADRVTTRASARASARLSREGIVAAAIALADGEGLDVLSMRRLAQQLDVDAMSIYYHLHDKGALLDAMADAVVAEIEQDPAATVSGEPWTAALRSLIMAARRAMLRHRWAATLLAGRRSPTPASLRHIERALSVLRGGGCSVDLSHHALHLFGSRLLGFSQDLFDDSPAVRPTPAEAAAQAAALARDHPHVAELAAAVTHEGALGGCDDDREFEFALDILLDGLERRRRSDAGRT